jgi:hypothetical protein
MMEYHIASNLPQLALSGRAICKSIGSDGAAIESKSMSFGRSMFSLAYGAMQPHNHAEEIIYVLATKAGRVRFGATKDCSEGNVVLQPGMVLHFAPMEWHVFEFDEPDGYSDVLFFYAQTDNLRPETKN